MARVGVNAAQQELRNLLGSNSLGTFLGMPGTIPSELASLAGFDWVVLDLEHGELDFEAIGQAVLGFDGPVIVRVPSPISEHVGRALDRAAIGIMLPRIDSEEMLLSALSCLDYPPTGNRGVASYNRSAGWGSRSDTLFSTKPVAIVQVETRWASDNVEQLAANDRIDALFVGPLDLSFSLGVPRNFESPEFRGAIARSINAARTHGKSIGILATETNQAIDYLNSGFDFVAMGSDSTSLLRQFIDQVTHIRTKIND